MLSVILGKERYAPLRVLCLGAHSDDIEIGCGGTLLRLARDNLDLRVHWVVFAASGKRAEEALGSANQFLAQAKEKNVVVENFKDGFFPYVGGEIKEKFEKLKQEINPDVVFTHCSRDAHQDHRLICELTWNAFRNHLILEYEIPKYDGDLGSPNLFVHLDESLCAKKNDLILNHFQSQKDRDWFTEDTLLAIMRLRGIESRSPGRYAEGFYCRKIAL